MTAGARRKWWAILGIAVVSTMVMEACGGGAAPTSTPPPPTPTKVVGTATAVATPTQLPPTSTPLPVVKRGGTLTLPQPQDLGGFDPSRANDYTVFYMIGMDWSQLVRWGNKKWSDTTVVGDLATSWDVSSDGKTYTYKLDPNAKWQNIEPVNGRALTAQDVKWYFDLIMREDYKSLFRSNLVDVVNVEAPDAQTVKFNLKAPFAGFNAVVANPRLKVVAKEQFDRDGNFEKAVIGSGAWMYKSRERGARVVNERNPNYWKKGLDGKALPYIDTVEFVIMADQGAHIAGIRSGQLGFETPGGLDAVQAKDFMQANPGIPMLIDSKLYANFLTLNMKKDTSVFKNNLKLRQAIMKGVDQKLLATNAVQDADAALESPITSGLMPYSLAQDELKPRLAFDLAGAKKLLADAGYQPGSLSFKIQPVNPAVPGTANARAMEVLKQELGDLGVNVTIFNPSTQTEAYNAVFNYSFDLLLGTSAYEGDVYTMFRSNYKCTGTLNRSGACFPELDKMIEQFDGTLDKTKSLQLAQDIQRFILDQATTIPLVTGRQYIPQQPWLKNFSRSWPWGFGGLEGAWIDK